LLLIDNTLSDISYIIQSLEPFTDYWVFDFSNDSFDTLKSIVTKSYDSIGIAQHYRGGGYYQMFSEMIPAVVFNVSTEDPSLNSWHQLSDLVNHFKGLGVNNYDFLICDLWANPDWRYVIEQFEAQSGIHMRASINVIGIEGDYIFESDGTSMIGIYFTQDIIQYKYSFYYSAVGVVDPHTAYNPPVSLPWNGGTFSSTEYVSLFGSMINSGTAYGGATYINPPSTINNVVNVYNTANGAYAVLTASGQVITFGVNFFGGDSSVCASQLLSGVRQIAVSSQGFSALTASGTVVSWGYVNFLPITTTGNSKLIPPPSSLNLTNYTSVVASSYTHTYAALNASGGVVTWGYTNGWTLPNSSVLFNVTKIVATSGYPSYSFCALRSDGHAVMWGSAGVTTTVSLTSTSPIVEIYPTPYGCVIQRADGTVYTGFSNTVAYTIPNGRTVVQFVPCPNSSQFFMLFDNATMYGTITGFVTGPVSNLVLTDETNTYAYISNGAVVAGGSARYGGSTTGTYGIANGKSVSSGVIQLVSGYKSIAALLSDGTVTSWGDGGSGYANLTAVQSKLTNVVQLFALYNGCLAVTSDNRIVSWGANQNQWYYTSTSTASLLNEKSITPGQTVGIFPLNSSVPVSTALIVGYTPQTTISVTNTNNNTLAQNVPSTITYSTNIQSKMANVGHTYGLYNGATLLSTFIALTNTYTYTFTNVVITTAGNVSLSVVDTTTNYTIANSSSTPGLTMNSVSLRTEVIPDPPIINSVAVVSGKVAVSLTPAEYNGTSPLTGFKVSVDNGLTYQVAPTTSVATSVTFDSSSLAISAAGSLTSMMRLALNAAGNKMYVTNINGNLYTSSYNGTSWTDLSLVNGFTMNNSSYGFAMNAAGTRFVSSTTSTSACYTFTDAFSPMVRTLDTNNGYNFVGGLSMSQDGSTIVATDISGRSVLYAKWSDADENFGPFIKANSDSVATAGNGVAISADGKLIAYPSNTAATNIKYAVWNGTGFNEGKQVLLTNPSGTNLPYAAVGMKISNDGLMLLACTINSGVFASYWNGTAFTPFVQMGSYINPAVNSWGIDLDPNNNLYISNYGQEGIYKFKLIETTIANSLGNFTLPMDMFTLGTLYTLGFKASNIYGDSSAVFATNPVAIYSVPDPPTINSVSVVSGQVKASLNVPTYTGTSAFTGFKWSNDNGLTFQPTPTSAVTTGVTFDSSSMAIPAAGAMLGNMMRLAINTAGTTMYVSNIDGNLYTSSYNGTSWSNLTLRPSFTMNGACYGFAMNGAGTRFVSSAVSTSKCYMFTNAFSTPVRTLDTYNSYMFNGSLSMSQDGTTIAACDTSGRSVLYAKWSDAANNFGSFIKANNDVVSTAGNAVAVNADGTLIAYPTDGATNIKYAVWNGTRFNAGTQVLLTNPSGTNLPFPAVGMKFSNDGLMLLACTIKSGLFASYWNGTAFTPFVQMGAYINQAVNSWGIDLDSNNNVYIANYGQDGIYKFKLIKRVANNNLENFTLPMSQFTLGTNYTLQFKASNLSGDSSAVIAPNSVAIYSVPDAPTINSVTATSGQISMVLTAPEYTGISPLTGYRWSKDAGATYQNLSGQAYVTSVTNSAYSTVITGTSTSMSRMGINGTGTKLYIPQNNGTLLTSTVSGGTWSVPTAIPSFTIVSSSFSLFGFAMNGAATRFVAVSNINKGCYFFTNAFSAPIRTLDPSYNSHTFFGISMTLDGSRICACDECPYYANWIDASQNYGPFVKANSDPANSPIAAITPNGNMIAYATGSTGWNVTYAVWNGTGYNSGTTIPAYPASTYSVTQQVLGLRFSPDGLMLFATTYNTGFFVSYWNGTAFSQFRSLGTPVTTSTPAWDCVMDNSNNLYHIYSTGATSIGTIYKYVITQNTSTNNLLGPFTIPNSEFTQGTSYILQVKSTTSTGESNAVIAPNAIVPFIAPDAPTINNVFATRDKVVASLTAPTYTGSAALSGYKYSIDNGSTFQAAPSQTVGTGITFDSSSVAIPNTTTLLQVGRLCLDASGTTMYIAGLYGNLYTSSYTGTSWGTPTQVSGFSMNGMNNSSFGFAMNGAGTRFVCTGIASTACYTFTNAFSTPIRTLDTNNNYKFPGSVCMSQDGTTIATIDYSGNSLLYAKWIDASQNYGPFIKANNDVVTTYGLGMGMAINSDGTLIVYPTSANAAGISYTVWNGSGFNPGTPLYLFPAAQRALKLSNDGLILVASLVTEETHISYWNGITFTPFVNMVGVPALASMGVDFDPSNNLYMVNYNATLSSPVYKVKLIQNTTTTSTSSRFSIPNSAFTLGNSYTLQFKATNLNGDSTAVTASSAVVPYSLPGAPTILTASGGNASIALTFSAPVTNGSAITCYYYSINGGTTFVSTGSAATTYTITGLTNGTTYTVLLKSANAAGVSTAYATSAAILVASVPGVPTGISCVAASNQITVSFTVPANGGSAITGYKYATVTSGAYTYVAQPSGPIVITGLTNGAAYQVSLKAVNSIGDSTATGTTAVTLVAGVPSAPVLNTVVPGNGTLTANYTAPANGGTAISNYYYSTDGGTIYTSLASTSTTALITGLTNGNSYSVVVKAVNSSGNSLASNAIIAIPVTVPGAPTINSVSGGNQSLSVSYSAPASNGGSAITGYKYSINSGSTYISCGSGNPFVISGLTNGTLYTVLLQAVSAVGVSTAATSSPTAPFTVPGTPTLGSIVPGNRTLQVSYTAPANNGGSAVTSYYYSYDRVNYTSISASGNPFTISGLTNGQSYQISMMAVNPAGNSAVSALSVAGIPRNVPNPPDINYASFSNGQMSVLFSAPTYDGGNAITGYAYTLNSGSYVACSLPSFSIPSLAVDQIYSIQVYAQNAAGYSAGSSAFQVVPLNAPLDPVVTGITMGNGSASLTFVDGSAQLYCPPTLGYIYKVTNVSTGISITQYARETTTPILIQNLTNGTNYSFALQAYNSQGNSPFSGQTITGIPAAAPNPPTITSVVGGNGSATINITDGSNNGSAITGYKYSIDGSTYTTVGNTKPIVITGLSNRTWYPVVVQAVNELGTSANSNVSSIYSALSAPEPPIITSITEGNGTVSVNITDGSNNGGAITGYRYSVDGLTYTTVGNAKPIVITGINNNTCYPVVIQAINAYGTSADSNASIFHTPFKAPSPPTITSAVGYDASAMIYITDGSTNGSPITGYRYSINGSTYTTVNSTTKPLVITGINNNTWYPVVVQAVSALGTSADSNVSSFFTPCTPPAAPTITSVVAGNASASVTITNGATNGKPILGYKWSLNGINYTTVSDPSTTFLVPGLTNATSYVVLVKAYNAIGDSPVSNLSSMFTPYTIPAAPTILSIVPGNQQVTFTVQNNPANGATILGYEWSIDNNSWTTVNTLGNTVTITGLVNGNAYAVFLKSVSNAGVSASTKSATFVPANVPSAVVINRVTPGDQKLVIDFSNGVLNGAPIQYYMYSFDGSTYKYTMQDASPIVLYPIPNSVNYTVRLKAANTAGLSQASNEVGPIMPFGTPFAPVITQVLPGDACVDVYFTINNNGSPITRISYVIGSLLTDFSGNLTSPLTIRGLTNGKAITFSLYASNAAGMSLSSVSKTITPGVPFPPTINSITRGDGKFIIDFSASTITNGSPITGYAWVDLCGNSSKPIDIVFLKGAGLSSPVTIISMTNGTMYHPVLVTKNKNGSSAYSNSVGPVLPYGAPLEMATPPTVDASFGQLFVSFLPKGLKNSPIDNGNPITKYQYHLNTDPSTNTWTDASGITVDGSGVHRFSVPILNNIKYIVNVAAVNAAGRSKPSKSSLLTPPNIPIWYFNPPLQPDAPTVTPSFELLNVVVTPPKVVNPVGATNSYPITGYKYSLNWAPFVYAGTSPKFTIPVSNNVKYIVSVIACNLAGDSVSSKPSKETQYVFVPPLAPTGVTLVASYQTLTVKYKPPTPVTYKPPQFSDNYPVLTYKYALNGSTTFIDASTTDLSFVIHDVSNNFPHSIQLVAVNAAGASASPSTAVFAKAYPWLPPTTAPVITGNVLVGNNTASFSFTKPAITTSTNAPITSYWYTFYGTPANSSGYVFFDGSYTYYDLSYTALASTAISATLTGLTNDLSYNMALVAKTPAGISPLSAPKTFMPYYRPPAAGPTGLVATFVASGTINLAYKAPVESNAPITTYKYSINGGDIINLDSSANPLRISGLQNDVSFNLRLYAGTPAGNSPPSTPLTVFIVYAAPSAPVITSITPWNASARVNFTPPAKTNNSAIIGYKYSTDVSGLVLQDVPALDASGKITITGLVNDVSYNIRLYAVNGVGTSVASNMLQVKPIHAVPAKPTIVKITPTTTSATVAFSPPTALNGGDITSYKYALNGATTYIDVGLTPNNVFTVTGLTPNTSYTFALVAVNDVGQSLPSLPSQFKTITAML